MTATCASNIVREVSIHLIEDMSEMKFLITRQTNQKTRTCAPQPVLI